ncbi:MAG: T9SS type A sorting domain-containing protein, partial [bacterium]
AKDNPITIPPQSTLGIYTMDCESLNEQGSITKSFQRFAVSNSFYIPNETTTSSTEIQNSTSTIQNFPLVSSLLQSFPNPAENFCFIPFTLAQGSCVSLTIYNILGQKIRTIEAGNRKAGSYTNKEKAIFWDLRNDSNQNVSKGLYFYQLKADGFSDIKAMVVK